MTSTDEHPVVTGRPEPPRLRAARPAIPAEDIDRRVEGQTFASRWLATVAAHGERIALRSKDGDRWLDLSYGALADRVARAATGLRALGVRPGDRVVLLMRNIVEFHVVDLATVFCGATPVSIYNTSSPEQIAYLAGHCGATVAVVEDLGFLERLELVRDRLPALRHVVLVSDPERLAPPDAVPLSTLLDHPPADLPAALATITPEMPATIIYTSGTTGLPKGVVLTHRNIVWTAQGYLDLLDADPVGFRAVSYLPMAHVAERMAGHYLAGIGGYEITTCPDATMVATYVREVHPQTMFGVPRVWEKIQAGVQAALAADPEARTRFDEAVAAAEPIVERRTAGVATAEDDETWAFLDEVAFSKVRALVGLDALELAVTGAAPIPASLIRWYRAIGVPMSEIYGLSETSGPVTWEPYRVRPGTVGVPFPGVEVALADDGEVHCRGGNVFAGYLDDPQLTAAVIDADGWFATGDVGEIDADGFLRIIDRKKEILITAGGKNVSPANLETALRSIPPIAYACAVGDEHPFITALLVLDPDVAPAWAAALGVSAGSLAELAAEPTFVAYIERCVADVMAPFSSAERVKKVAILPDEWVLDGDELTPTGKLKRRSILAKHADRIDRLYRR